jgi:hypothetical protein
MEWMYQGGPQVKANDADEYLLGKPVPDEKEKEPEVI